MKDGENCYILKFDCSNVNEVAKKLANKPKKKVKLPEDIYKKILAPGKSTYIQKINSKWLVKATNKYFLTRTSDNELARINNVDRFIPEPGYTWETSYERKEILLKNEFIEVVKEIKLDITSTR